MKNGWKYKAFFLFSLLLFVSNSFVLATENKEANYVSISNVNNNLCPQTVQNVSSKLTPIQFYTSQNKDDSLQKSSAHHSIIFYFPKQDSLLPSESSRTEFLSFTKTNFQNKYLSLILNLQTLK